MEFNNFLKVFVLVLLLMAIAIPLSNGIGIGICNLQARDGSIEMVAYDKSRKICCGQRLSQRTENIDCCGGKYVYNTMEQVCCNGRVDDKHVPRKNGSKDIDCTFEGANCVENMCCGNKLISKDENTVCCDGNRIDLTETQVQNRDFLDCCGDQVIDLRNNMCCSKTPIPWSENLGCCGDEVYLRSKYKCIQDRKIKTTQNFCGQKKYDASKGTCCDEHLVENVAELIEKEPGMYMFNPDAECCGGNVLGKDQKCCEKFQTGFPTHAIRNHTYLKCCGQGSHDTRTQFCLKGVPVDKSPDHALCGDHLINTTFQKCCANKLPYNISDQDCCEGAWYCVIKKGEECCNGFKMNDNELCCENKKPCKKRNYNDDGCCYDSERDNGQTFIRKNESCRNGQIHHVPEHYIECKSGEYYDPDYYFCCSSRRYRLGDGQCCNNVYSTLPPSEGKCCQFDGHMYKHGDSANPCLLECNKKESYDPFSELCCEGNKFKYTGNNYCCGPFAIDSDMKYCCGEKLPFPIWSRKDCCWNKQVYSKRHFQCLNTGEVVPKRKMLDTQKLCNPLNVKLFDGGIQQACWRNNALRGRVVDVQTTRLSGGDLQVNISLTKVMVLGREKDTDSTFEAPKNLKFDVHISHYLDCAINHLKKLKRVIILFDLPPNGIQQNTVKISKNAPFFLTRQTYYRRYAVTKVATKSHCTAFL